jgi:hypothetical protein
MMPWLRCTHNLYALVELYCSVHFRGVARNGMMVKLNYFFSNVTYLRLLNLNAGI